MSDAEQSAENTSQDDFDVFPFEGKIIAREWGYKHNLEENPAYVSASPKGDFLQEAADEILDEYGEGVTVLVKFHGDGFGDCEDYTILGKAAEQEADS